MRRIFASALLLGVLAIPSAAAAPFEADNFSFTPVGNPAEIALLKQDAEEQAREARRKRAARRTSMAATKERPSMPPHLAAIAACESGGNPRAIGGGGLYRGLFQFDRGTWASVGGSGDPAAASPAEQIKRAEILYSRAGSAPWPVCG